LTGFDDLNGIFRRFVKERWGYSWINVRYPDGCIFISQPLETGATAHGELPGGRRSHTT